jgi:lipid II:glycine glycyltransferase (peptidoglycan interpeptide bridge formation enzyme)
MRSGQFLQSNEWQKFQESLGRKTWRIDDALIIKMPLKFGFSYLYSPKLLESRIQKLEIRIKKIAKDERAIFWRIEPADKPPENFIKTSDVQPRCTQILDLIKSEDELLAKMRPKTRYNIRLAAKKGVQVSLQLFNEFYNLLRQTAERQKIKLHPKKYYKKLAEFNEIYIAYCNDAPIAGAMINFYKDTATYLHGGSSDWHKNLMAPYLLHWEIIKAAKARQMKYYDWWGVDEKRWPGITRFKKGFGGEGVCSPGTYDLQINKALYWLYELLHCLKIRRS